MPSLNRLGPGEFALWIGFALALLVAAVAGHMVSVDLYAWAKSYPHGSLFYAVACSVSFGAGYLFANSLRRRHRLRWPARALAGYSDRLRARLCMACIAIAAFGLHGLALCAHDVLHLPLIIPAAVFITAIVAAEQIEERIAVPRGEAPAATPDLLPSLRIKALALMVSRHEAKLIAPGSPGGPWSVSPLPRPGSPPSPTSCSLTASPDSLEADIKALTDAGIIWNWQQLLRAIRSFNRHKRLFQNVRIGR